MSHKLSNSKVKKAEPDNTFIIEGSKSVPRGRMVYKIEKIRQPEAIIIKVGPDNNLIIEERSQGSKGVPRGRMVYKIEKICQPEAIIIKVGPDNNLIIEEIPRNRPFRSLR